MKKKHKTLKKITTVVTCAIVVIAIASLCSVAYFRTESTSGSNTYTFTTADISYESSISSDGRLEVTNESKDSIEGTVKIPKEKYVVEDSSVAVYASKGYQFTYNCSVTNEGEKPIIAYVAITVPVYSEAGTGKEGYKTLLTIDTEVQGQWALVKQSKTYGDEDGAHIYYIYAYAKLLGSGETTPALKLPVTVNKSDGRIANNFLELDSDSGSDWKGYVKANIRTMAIGVQNPQTYRKSLGMGKKPSRSCYSQTEDYFWEGDVGYQYGENKRNDAYIMTYLNDIWSQFVNNCGIGNYFIQEIQYPFDVVETTVVSSTESSGS